MDQLYSMLVRQEGGHVCLVEEIRGRDFMVICSQPCAGGSVTVFEMVDDSLALWDEFTCDISSLSVAKEIAKEHIEAVMQMEREAND